MSNPSANSVTSPHILRFLVWIWLGITAWLSYEYLVLNEILVRKISILKSLNKNGFIFPGQKLSPHPGDSLSWFLGWLGFGLICLTNLYVIRKSKKKQDAKKNLSRWLDVHIFFGLLGPTLIVFHCNFKVRGLVAVSFWSMIICFVSGIVGRYFYMQLLRGRGELKSLLARYEQIFKELPRSDKSFRVSERDLEIAKSNAYAFVGGSSLLANGNLPLAEVLRISIVGDLKLLFFPIPRNDSVPSEIEKHLIDYALMLRRLHAGRYFRQLMGYWHSFHKPFAIFMYVVTVIHIAAALIFRV